MAAGIALAALILVVLVGHPIGGRPAISKQVPIPELEKRIRQLIEQKA
jgi:hypothetical protein